MLKKSLKRDILFLAAFLADLYLELSPTTFYRKLRFPDYKPKSISQTLARMLKAGEIERKVSGEEAVLKITPRGKEFLNLTIPLRKLAKKKWDKKWRIVIFDIPEKSKYLRDVLRNKLKELGFGKWQKSVYITPHPVTNEINEFLQAKHLFPRAICLEAFQSGLGDDKKVASYVFQLSRLDGEYLDVGDRLDKILQELKDEKIFPKEAFKKFQEVLIDYQQVISRDPFLPQELLPDWWSAEKVKRKLGYLTKKLVKQV